MPNRQYYISYRPITKDLPYRNIGQNDTIISQSVIKKAKIGLIFQSSRQHEVYFFSR